MVHAAQSGSVAAKLVDNAHRYGRFYLAALLVGLLAFMLLLSAQQKAQAEAPGSAPYLLAVAGSSPLAASRQGVPVPQLTALRSGPAQVRL